MTDKTDLTPKTKIVRNQNILATDLGDEVVMMDINSGQYFNLEAVGASVWNQIEEPKPLELILKSLQDEFEVDPDTCEQEVRNFIEQMVELEMVKLA